MKGATIAVLLCGSMLWTATPAQAAPESHELVVASARWAWFGFTPGGSTRTITSIEVAVLDNDVTSDVIQTVENCVAGTCTLIRRGDGHRAGTAADFVVGGGYQWFAYDAPIIMAWRDGDNVSLGVTTVDASILWDPAGKLDRSRTTDEGVCGNITHVHRQGTAIATGTVGTDVLGNSLDATVLTRSTMIRGSAC